MGDGATGAVSRFALVELSLQKSGRGREMAAHQLSGSEAGRLSRNRDSRRSYENIHKMRGRRLPVELLLALVIRLRDPDMNFPASMAGPVPAH